MNYEWTFPWTVGLGFQAPQAAFNASWQLDYSRQAYPTLDELNLTEATGAGISPSITEGVLPVFNPLGMTYTQFVAGDAPVDWDADNDGNDTHVRTDINGDGIPETLVGFNDWPNLVYNFRGCYAFANGVHTPEDVNEPSLLPSSTGVLSYQPPAGPNDLTLRLNGANLEIFDNLAQIPVASMPLAQTRLVQVIGADGQQNRLTVDFSFGGFFTVSGGISFSGGSGGTNSLRIIGTGQTTGSYTPDSALSGSGIAQVSLGNQSVTIGFTGLRPLEVSATASYQFVTPNSSDNLTVAAGSGSGGQPAEVITGSSGGVPFEALTFFAIPSFTLDAGANDAPNPKDVINVQSTLSGTTTTVLTHLGPNLINVGSTAGVVPATAGILDTIQGPLGIVGSGSDTLNQDDTGSKPGQVGTLTASTLTGLNMAGITYQGLANLKLALGSSDTLNIQATAAGTATTVSTLGHSVLNVGSLAPGLGGMVTGIQGALTMQGANSDTLNVDDMSSKGPKSGTLTPTALLGLGMGPGGITFNGLSGLNLTLGPGASPKDRFTFTSINLPSLATGPRYLSAAQNSASRLTVTGNISGMYVNTGIPGSFNQPLGTVTLFGGYGPWVLHGVFFDPPAPSPHAAVTGSTSVVPTVAPRVQTRSGPDSTALDQLFVELSRMTPSWLIPRWKPGGSMAG
jgi:hypothetical protein